MHKMAGLVVLALGGAYLLNPNLNKNDGAPNHEKVPMDYEEEQWDDQYNDREMYRRGLLPTQYQYWTVGTDRKLISSREPFPRREPLPHPRQQGSRLVEDVSLNMSDTSKEYMRQEIEDATDFDATMFRGERAFYRPELQRRRQPIINNPGLTTVTFPEASVEEGIVPPFKDWGYERPWNLYRSQQPKYGWATESY